MQETPGYDIHSNNISRWYMSCAVKIVNKKPIWKMAKYISLEQAIEKLKSMFPDYDDEFLRTMIISYSNVPKLP